MALTKVAPAGIGSTPGDGYRIGSSFLHSTGVEITNINATGILTAASLDISGAIDFDGHTELDNVNIAGVVTATTFKGDGSQLTGFTAGQIPNLDGSKITTGTVAAARIDNLSGAKITSGTVAAARIDNLSGAKITSGTVAAARIDNLAASKITSGTVATARLGSGTANNSSFLRGDQTWAAVTSTTINNNANNRIITGSGTANTLEGEANITCDGDSIVVTQGSSNIGFEVHSTGSGRGAQTKYHNDHSVGCYIGVSGNTTGDMMVYNEANTNTIFYTNSAERLRIASAGAFGLGGANYGSSGQVLTSAGSGSVPTWTTITGTTINNNANNRLITGSGTANTLEGESTLTYNGSGVLEIDDSGSSYTLRGAGTTKHELGASASDNDLVIQNNKGAGNVTSDIIFKGSGAGGGTVSEKMRITDKGVGINHNTSGTSSNAALTIKNRTQSTATRFNLVNQGSSSVESTQIYSQNNDLVFVAGASDALRIKSDGQLKIKDLSTTAINALTGVEGSIVYDTTINVGKIYNGSSWLQFGGGAPVWVTAAGNLSTIYNMSRSTYSIANLSTNSSGGAVTYTVTSGSLPGGMSLSSSGAFSGTVNLVGSDTTSTFTVTATNSVGTTDRIFNIIVKASVSQTYSFSGSTVTWNRPHANVKLVEFKMWGGAGSQGTCSSNGNHAGAGGMATGQINTASRAQLYLQVGEAGESPNSGNSAGGWPNGGEGNDEHSCKGGGGGGSSNIYNENGTGSYNNLLAVAGGGGGVSHGNPNSNGGDGGGSSGSNSNRGGNGGSQNAGGNPGSQQCGNASNAGSLMQGGNAGTGSGCTNSAAGGGGGYYGGGAGGNSNSGNSYGGGGGGSGYYDSNNVSSASLKSYGESGWSSDKPSSVAVRPSSSDNTRGGHGYIILWY